MIDQIARELNKSRYRSFGELRMSKDMNKRLCKEVNDLVGVVAPIGGRSLFGLFGKEINVSEDVPAGKVLVCEKVQVMGVLDFGEGENHGD